MNVLFTGIGRRIELVQAFRNAALVLNQKIKVYGVDIMATAPALTYCDYVRTVVPMKDSLYIDNLLQICAEDSIDLVVPTIDTDLLALSENREKFLELGTRVLISAPEKIRICRDKNLTSGFFQSCGLHSPVPVSNWRNYNSGFPAFIKPKDGSSSINAFKVENIDELEVYSNHVNEYIVQPYIEGKEYTIDILCDFLGEPISIVPRERIQIRAGEVLKTRITMDSIMIEESRKICKKFKPCGPITVQLIREAKTGIDYFIEINPRFGGGSPLSMKAGARSAEMLLKLLNEETPDRNQEIADGSVYSRFDQSVCIVEGKKRIKGVIFDLDDTLYSEKEYIRSGFKVVCQHLGGDYEEKLWGYFDDGKKAIDELLKVLGRESEKDTIIEIYRNHKPNIHLYPGAAEMLGNLKDSGIKVGIITDGRPEGQRKKISSLGIKIEDIIITDELGGTQFRKPCDIAFRMMQLKWRIYPDEIVYIADNPYKDFQAPKQLGMKCIYFKNADGLYSDREVGFETITNLEEIRKIVIEGETL